MSRSKRAQKKSQSRNVKYSKRNTRNTRNTRRRFRRRSVKNIRKRRSNILRKYFKGGSNNGIDIDKVENITNIINEAISPKDLANKLINNKDLELSALNLHLSGKIDILSSNNKIIAGREQRIKNGILQFLNNEGGSYDSLVVTTMMVILDKKGLDFFRKFVNEVKKFYDTEGVDTNI